MEARIVTVETKVDMMARELPEIKEVLKTMATNLAQLAVFNVEKEHMEATIDQVNSRLSRVEEALPAIKLTSGWVQKGVLLVMGILGVSFVGVVLKIIFFGLNTGVIK